MSSLAPAPEGAGSRAERVPGPARSWHPTGDVLLGLAIAAALTLLAFITTGGVALGPNTWAQIVLILLGAGLGIALLLTGPRGRVAGLATLGLFAALAALTFASIAWSVQPAGSWVEANRTLSYLAAFGAAMALVRLVPGRWRALIGAIALYAVIVAVYALLTKVFPASMDAGDALARVRAPFDYYNATGLVAALGIPACVWLGARRDGLARADRVLAAASVPAIGALACTLILSYGRGALGAAVIALAVWFAWVPLRLRGVLVLALGALGGGIAAAWATGQSAIANDNTLLAARVSSGHSFGLVLVIVLVLLAAAGWGVTVVFRRPALPALVRRRIGIALLCALALVPLGGLLALATSARGFGGEVSHLWTSLTNPNGFVLDQPGRLAQLGSSRPRYWRDGLRVGEHAPLAGTGAFGFATAVKRYSADKVQEAHSYVIQTFADFGAIGLVVSAGLLIAWALAVRRTLGGVAEAHAPPPGRAGAARNGTAGAPGATGAASAARGGVAGAASAARGGVAGAATGAEGEDGPAAVHAPGAERAGLFSLLAITVAFGVHSTIDWTWFIPGAAVPALLCAGWLAGRGTRASATRADGGARDAGAREGGAGGGGAHDGGAGGGAGPWRIGGALALGAAALLAAWIVWQPLRSYNADTAAMNALLAGNAGAAFGDARTAAAADPVDIQPHQYLSEIYLATGDVVAARDELVKATTLQPSNPESWRVLANFDAAHHRAADARRELARAHALSPYDPNA